MNGNARPAKFEPPPTQPIDDVGERAGELHLRERLLADDRLVQEHVVEHAAERVGRVLAPRRVLDRLGDRDPEAARASRGRSARIARPACVSSDGLGDDLAPQVWIIERRNGFWSYETLTM